MNYIFRYSKIIMKINVRLIKLYWNNNYRSKHSIICVRLVHQACFHLVLRLLHDAFEALPGRGLYHLLVRHFPCDVLFLLRYPNQILLRLCPFLRIIVCFFSFFGLSFCKAFCNCSNNIIGNYSN